MKQVRFEDVGPTEQDRAETCPSTLTTISYSDKLDNLRLQDLKELPAGESFTGPFTYEVRERRGFPMIAQCTPEGIIYYPKDSIDALTNGETQRLMLDRAKVTVGADPSTGMPTVSVHNDRSR